MMNSEQRQKIMENRLVARRRYLNRHDITEFSNVPGFIVNAFFGEGTYHSRLLVSTFGFINGLNEHQVITLLKWNPLKHRDMKNISHLLKWLTNNEKSRNYYSYNVSLKQVMYCNGDLRIFGERIIKK
jgi:hypothetical protein